MVNAHELFMPEDEVFLGEIRKYGIDPSRPWWERWFFRGIFLPFVRFAFNRMHIPAHGAIDRDGRFSWVETVIVTFDKELAETASQDEFYCVRRYPINSGLPKESVQYKGHRYPNSVMPDRYRRLVHPLTVKATREVEAERKALLGLYQKVEGLGAKIREPVT